MNSWLPWHVTQNHHVDFERKVIHIRQSKYKKDRIVPLAESMAVGLKKYLSAENGYSMAKNPMAVTA